MAYKPGGKRDSGASGQGGARNKTSTKHSGNGGWKGVRGRTNWENATHTGWAPDAAHPEDPDSSFVGGGKAKGGGKTGSRGQRGAKSQHGGPNEQPGDFRPGRPGQTFYQGKERRGQTYVQEHAGPFSMSDSRWDHWANRVTDNSVFRGAWGTSRRGTTSGTRGQWAQTAVGAKKSGRAGRSGRGGAFSGAKARGFRQSNASYRSQGIMPGKAGTRPGGKGGKGGLSYTEEMRGFREDQQQGLNNGDYGREQKSRIRQMQEELSREHAKSMARGTSAVGAKAPGQVSGPAPVNQSLRVAKSVFDAGVTAANHTMAAIDRAAVSAVKDAGEWGVRQIIGDNKLENASDYARAYADTAEFVASVWATGGGGGGGASMARGGAAAESLAAREAGVIGGAIKPSGPLGFTTGEQMLPGLTKGAGSLSGTVTNAQFEGRVAQILLEDQMAAQAAGRTSGMTVGEAAKIAQSQMKNAVSETNWANAPHSWTTEHFAKYESKAAQAAWEVGGAAKGVGGRGASLWQQYVKESGWNRLTPTNKEAFADWLKNHAPDPPASVEKAWAKAGRGSEAAREWESNWVKRQVANAEEEANFQGMFDRVKARTGNSPNSWIGSEYGNPGTVIDRSSGSVDLGSGSVGNVVGDVWGNAANAFFGAAGAAGGAAGADALVGGSRKSPPGEPGGSDSGNEKVSGQSIQAPGLTASGSDGGKTSAGAAPLLAPAAVVGPATPGAPGPAGSSGRSRGQRPSGWEVGVSGPSGASQARLSGPPGTVAGNFSRDKVGGPPSPGLSLGERLRRRGGSAPGAAVAGLGAGAIGPGGATQAPGGAPRWAGPLGGPSASGVLSAPAASGVPAPPGRGLRGPLGGPVPAVPTRPRRRGPLGPMPDMPAAGEPAPPPVPAPPAGGTPAAPGVPELQQSGGGIEFPGASGAGNANPQKPRDVEQPLPDSLKAKAPNIESQSPSEARAALREYDKRRDDGSKPDSMVQYLRLNSKLGSIRTPEVRYKDAMMRRGLMPSGKGPLQGAALKKWQVVSSSDYGPKREDTAGKAAVLRPAGKSVADKWSKLMGFTPQETVARQSGEEIHGHGRGSSVLSRRFTPTGKRKYGEPDLHQMMEGRTVQGLLRTSKRLLAKGVPPDAVPQMAADQLNEFRRSKKNDMAYQQAQWQKRKPIYKQQVGPRNQTQRNRFMDQHRLIGESAQLFDAANATAALRKAKRRAG